MNHLKFIKIILMIFLCSSLTVGCSSRHKKPMTQQCALTTAMRRLHENIIKIPKKNGERFVLAIASRQVFNSNSANISAGGQKTLNNVASLIRCFETVDIKVTNIACANNYQNHHIYITPLAKERSYRVANFLWSKNIDARVAYIANSQARSCRKRSDDKIMIDFEVWKK